MKNTLTILFLLFAVTGFSQAPSIQWAKCFGGEYQDDAHCIHQTPDHGFIVGGLAESDDGDVTGNHGYADAWVVKLDSLGNIQWERSYGGSDWDDIVCIRPTSDGGYIFTGNSFSSDGDVTGHHGLNFYADAWVIKIDALGNIQWERSYGGTLHETPYDIIQTFDGGYILAASSASNDGDVTGHHGIEFNYDYWIVKLDPSGNIQWENCYGGSSDEEPCSILQAPQGDYVVIGTSVSNDGDVTGHHGSLNKGDVWIIKLTGNGKFIGGTSLPNYEEQSPKSACFSTTGGYIIGGLGDDFPNHGIIGHGNYDLMLMKVSKRWKLDTACAMGGSNAENANSVSPTKDGGYLIVGFTLSSDGDVVGYHGEGDYWVLKLDSLLRLQWDETLGGTGGDQGWSGEQTSDGGYIVAGQTDSYDFQVTGNHGSADYWVVKLAPDNTPATVTSNKPASPSKNNSNHLSVYPNHARNEENISFPFSNNIIIISDLVGREMKRMEVSNGNSTLMNVSSLQDGVYILSIRDEKGNLVASEKLFKQ